jgi:iron complex transport system substrate-binding protein
VKKGKSEKAGLVIALVLSALVAGCHSSTNNVANATTPIRPMQIVTDDLERRITVPTKIGRVVSTAPSVTEMIFAAGGGDRLVGVTTFCNYPEEAKSIAKIGDTMNPNMESIVALKPDVVFVSTASQIEAFAKTLEQNGISVYVMNPTSIEGVFKNLEKLGSLFESQDETQIVVDDLQRRLKAVYCSDPLRCGEKPADHHYVAPSPPKVFVQISNEPLFTIGKQSFLTDLIPNAGGKSVTSDVETAYPKLSKETALALQPEVIILSASDDNREPNDVFRNSPAVNNGRVYRIDADILSRPGPRLVDALEQIAKLLHPEKFRDK